MWKTLRLDMWKTDFTNELFIFFVDLIHKELIFIYSHNKILFFKNSYQSLIYLQRVQFIFYYFQRRCLLITKAFFLIPVSGVLNIILKFYLDFKSFFAHIFFEFTPLFAKYNRLSSLISLGAKTAFFL